MRNKQTTKTGFLIFSLYASKYFLLLWKANKDRVVVEWVGGRTDARTDGINKTLSDPRQNYHIKGKTVSAAQKERERRKELR